MIPALARAVGGFYLMGGIFMLRALGVSGFLDLALAAIERRGGRRLMVRSTLLSLGGVLTAASGLALLLLHDLAIPLMLANVVMQVLWLVVATLWFPPEDDEDRRGRLSTMRAAALFAGMTLLVLWLERSGRLAFAATELSTVVLAMGGGGIFLWQVYALFRQGQGLSAVSGTDDAASEEIITCYLPARLHLEPRYFTPAIWDADSGQPLDPEEVDLPPDLQRRIIAFGLEAGRIFDAEQPGGSRIGDQAARALLEAEAQAIAEQLFQLVGEENVTWRVPEDETEWRALTI